MKADLRHSTKRRSPWFWVPSLYFAEGIPYIVVMTVSVAFYKKMGISNAAIALYTSWLYLPWVIKPLWSPVVDILRTKRFWIVLMQLIVGIALAAVAFSVPIPTFFQITLAFFWLLAFTSATHDIAADGFYMMGLTQHQQAWFVGVRSTFYRFAMLAGTGLIPMLVGYIESHTGLSPLEITVHTTRRVQQSQRIISPDSLFIKPEPGPIRIVTYPEKIMIPMKKKTRAQVKGILESVQTWNRTGRWQFPSKGLAQPSPGSPGNAGNIALVYFYLSRQPRTDEKIVVTFGREKGDKSISLVEGERFVFTSRNWNKPYLAAIQLDPKLRRSTSARFAARAGNVPLSWTIAFLIVAVLFLLFSIYHRLILPPVAEDTLRKPPSAHAFFHDFLKTFILFFKKEHIGIAIAFLLLYRLAESQIVKMGPIFLLDSQEAGGIALTMGQFGFVYGTVGLIMLTIGGLLGGFMAARDGLRRWLLLMVIAINLPDAVYVYLAHFQPDNYWIVNLCIGIEQFGYGFGFTAYMLYMIYVSEGEFKTAHFAITTGFMALGMMLPGMVSGYIQEFLGYEHFFIWVLICAIPGFLLLRFLPIDPEFGKKSGKKEE